MNIVIQAEDGTIFQNEADCEAYEAVLKNAEVIEAWAAENFGGKQGQATRAANVVKRWEAVRSNFIG
jgi:hypothetical protein